MGRLSRGRLCEAGNGLRLLAFEGHASPQHLAQSRGHAGIRACIRHTRSHHDSSVSKAEKKPAASRAHFHGDTVRDSRTAY